MTHKHKLKLRYVHREHGLHIFQCLICGALHLYETYRVRAAILLGDTITYEDRVNKWPDGRLEISNVKRVGQAIDAWGYADSGVF